ncbi:beta-lactamase family protein [Alkalicaulis satelles]|uniref:Beta-lactamase family protein n=1 Tax=Alkalicaulis satelles TaxID=2609175 RepID=A0A5M6ZKB0_9PROT|nr:serine hydrolase domain-containing protein [Alkalicaulis satelles]KAA5805249.1 beta-lactamase family protein [Alkalicaulis satelles]
MSAYLAMALGAALMLGADDPGVQGDAGSAMPELAGAASAASAAAAPDIDLPALDYFEPLMTRLEQAAGFTRTVGMAIAVIENGEPVLIYTSGETSAGSGEPVTADTQFRAASLSKGFTGVMLALLEHEGRADLNRTVPSRLLRLKSPRQPTWLEIVTHRTGLPRNAYDTLIQDGRSGAHARAQLADVDLVCAVGSCYTYQNVAFSALEHLIEEATGLSYEAALRQMIFEPYGLPDAGVGVAGLTAAPSWAAPHRGWSRIIDAPGNPRSNYDAVPSAASVTVSLNHLIAWVQAHLRAEEEGGLPEAVKARVFTPFTPTLRETRGLGGVAERISETHYGMGWRIYHWGDRRLIAHAGYLSGYGAQIVMEPETGFAFIGLWNSDGRAPWRLWPTVMDLRTGDGPGDWIDQIRN